MAPHSLWLLFATLTLHNMVASQNIGYFIVEMEPSTSYVLCSGTTQEREANQLRLLNVNDGIRNTICVESASIDLSSTELLFDIDSATLVQITKKQFQSLDRSQQKNRIELDSISPTSFHLKFQGSFITIPLLGSHSLPSSPTTPSFVLSDNRKLNFTFMDVDAAQSPFANQSTAFTTDVSSRGTFNATDAQTLSTTASKLGTRVRIDGRSGVVINHLLADDEYEVQFVDGAIGHFVHLNLSAVRIEHGLGTHVDAYWPADRLKLTNLADVLWPAVVVDYSGTADAYTLQYEDGSVHPRVPSIYVKHPAMACKDERSDCVILAQKQQCRTNPSFMLVQCRRSCRVCVASDDDDETDTSSSSEVDRDIESDEYFALNIDIDGVSLFDGDAAPSGIDVDGLAMAADDRAQDVSLRFSKQRQANVFDETQSLNAVGQVLMLSGNATLAEEFLLRASFLGHTQAKFSLAHLYAVQAPQRDERAVLYLYFAAMAGSIESNMALGYRHQYGYGVPKSCWIAANYFQTAANSLFGGASRSFNPMEQQHIEMVRLHDVQRRDLPMKESDEIVRFYHSHADNGDAHAQIALGQLYYYGLRGFEQNFVEAMRYFEMAAQQHHGEAYAMLADIYLDGIDELSIAKNVSKALHYYQMAIEKKSVAGYTGMAFLYLEGEEGAGGAVQKNATAALEYFKHAARKQDLSAAFYLGLMHFNGIGMKQKALPQAFEYFMSASRRGHAQSLYYAAYMHLHGLVTAKSCKMAVELFKMAAERTVVAKSLATARSHYLGGDYDRAYYMYSRLAVMGFEIAQSNVGWLLKRNLVSKPLLLSQSSAANETVVGSTETLKQLSRTAAFQYFEWSATQNNGDSQRIVGDYYYYDYLQLQTGTVADRYAEAGNYYEMAAENVLGVNAQSMFNLGYMHQYGLGRRKDFEMAKRYYDLSKQHDPAGNVACYIFLALLYAQKFYSEWFAVHTTTNWANLTTNLLAYIPTKWILDLYHKYAQELSLENIVLCMLLMILMVVLWIRH